MKNWIISLLVGLLAGGIYALLGIHSPAPPIVALLGLLGMLVGEQLVPIARRILARQPLTAAWFRHECVAKISGIPRPGRTDQTDKG